MAVVAELFTGLIEVVATLVHGLAGESRRRPPRPAEPRASEPNGKPPAL
jgi:hypothetical protein